MIRQPNLGHNKRRKPLPSCVIKEIHQIVDTTAKRFNVSRSFVIATALADVFGVKSQVDYKIYVKNKRK